MPLTIGALLRAGGIFYDVEPTGKREVLRQLVERLPLSPDHDRAALLRAVEAREAAGSTGIGEGIAIPHVGDATVLRVEAPFITLCLLSAPIAFDAIDSQPVHALFMVASPLPSIHVRILGRLGSLLRDDVLIERLRSRAPAEEILERIDGRNLTV